MMQSMSITKFGNIGVFKKLNIEKPTAKRGHVVIRVEATSVNPLDYKIRQGLLPNLVTKFPKILHGDVSGVVTEVGPDVLKFKVGDEVYGCAGGLLEMQGALAELMLVDSNLIAHKPKTLSFAEAAALPLVSLTAWEGLVTRAQVQKNQTVLVHGGTGGVGHIALQLAKYLGAKVFATSSTKEKLALAKSLGADVTINYKTTKLENYIKEQPNHGFDVIFDTIGGGHLQESIQAAALYGQIISILPSDPFDTSAACLKGLSLHFIAQPLPLITGHQRARYGVILTKIAELVDAGLMKPLIDPHTFSMENVGAAHQLAENNEAIGKVVISKFANLETPTTNVARL